MLYHISYYLIHIRQHRADAFISGTVFAGIAGSYAGFPILDPLAGILVSGFILQQAYTISKKGKLE